MGAKRKAKKEFEKEQELAKLRAAEDRKKAAESRKRAAKERERAAGVERRQEAAETARAERQAKLDARTPAEVEQDESEHSRETKVDLGGWAGWALAIVVAAVLTGGWLFIDSKGGSSNASNDAAEEVIDESKVEDDEPGVDQEVMEVSAFEVCKDFVKDRLKSPGSATFRNQFEDDGEVVVTGSGRGPYTIVSTVDSENSFGASLRSRFTCTVTNTDGDNWKLNDINIVQ